MKKTRILRTITLFTTIVPYLCAEAAIYQCTWTGTKTINRVKTNIYSGEFEYGVTAAHLGPTVVNLPSDTGLPSQASQNLVNEIEAQRKLTSKYTTIVGTGNRDEMGAEWVTTSSGRAVASCMIYIGSQAAWQYKPYNDPAGTGCGINANAHLPATGTHDVIHDVTGQMNLTADAYTATPVKFAAQATAEISYTQTTMDKTLIPTTLDTLPVDVAVSCVPIPDQLTIAISPDIHYGLTSTTPGASIKTEVTLSITSGTQVPTGTITFSSSKTNASGRVNLGGGEVRLVNKTSGTEYRMDEPYPIASRDTVFVAELNPTGATVGEATESLTVNLTVN